MSDNENTLAAKSGEAKETRAEKAIRLLTTAVGDPLKLKLKEFKPFYPSVRIAQSNGVPRKQILKYLADAGLKLYPNLYEKLMASMEKACTEGDGGSVTCGQCGQPLPVLETLEQVSDISCYQEQAKCMSACTTETTEMGELA